MPNSIEQNEILHDRTALAIAAHHQAPIEDVEHPEPHQVLGAHPVTCKGNKGVVIRAFHPDATEVACLLDGGRNLPMAKIGDAGLFGLFLEKETLPLAYRLCFTFADGNTWERDDPYRFGPTMGELDQHLFNQGTHQRIWTCLGSQVREMDGQSGVSFAVWAPNAKRVSVIGDFCHWDGRLFPMRQMGSSGVFELFIPDLVPGDLYKYEIKTQNGDVRIKTDPMAQEMEGPPYHASRVNQSSYTWRDDKWMASRAKRDWNREPISCYEVHLGSWARVQGENFRTLNYREIAHQLIPHVKKLGFTHIQLLPVAEHPLFRSWGYQVTGYFAPTHRYGSPDDFRHLIDECHANDIGVILDWVPAHFPRDDFALRRFDGTALYEHDDPRMGEHPDWDTLIFNYGRHEVRNFLLGNAVYWLKEFHIDGLRVDAVASMLYLDYSRQGDEWLPNPWGGKENVDAIELLRAFNEMVHDLCPGCITVAEESTAWNGVTKPVSDGGLGFDLKWNMGWMHDTLEYFSKDCVHRKHHQNDLTFASLYEHSERFVNALSHDEVVHGKKSLLEKMPGDFWQKFANLRALLAYQFTRPGKKLLFMGTELAPHNEWNVESELDWHLAEDPFRHGIFRLLTDLGQIYRTHECLFRGDPDHDSFAWIDCQDWEKSVFAYQRWHGSSRMIVIMNLTPVPRNNYRIGAPEAGQYVQVLNTDLLVYAGSGYSTRERLVTDPVPWHGLPQSLEITLPPLAVRVLAPEFPS